MKKSNRISIILISLAIFNLSHPMEEKADLSNGEIISRIINVNENSRLGIKPIIINDKIRLWRKGELINSPINVVLSSHLDNEMLACVAINAVKKQTKKLGGTLEWRVLPTTIPAHMNEILEKNDFTLNHVLNVMILSLDNEIDDIAVDKLISIEPLETPMIPSWTSILGRIYDCDWCTQAPYQKYIETGVTNKTGLSNSMEFYAGYYNGQLAATGGLLIADDSAYIYAMATDVMFRKKGLATQMTLTLLNRAKELHLKYVILECIESVIPFYSKFGFRKAFEIKSYCLDL